MLTARFGCFGLPGFWCNDQKTWFCLRIQIYEFEVFDWSVDWGNQTCNYGETWGRISMWFLVGSIFWKIWNISIPQQGNQLTSFVVLVCQKPEASDWKVDGRGQASSYGEIKVFKISIFQKFFFHFLPLKVYRDWNAISKTYEFSVKCACTSREFRLILWWKK